MNSASPLKTSRVRTAYPEHIQPGLWHMALQLCRIAWHVEELTNRGPVRIRTARIALGSTQRLFDIILGVALRNRLISMSGEAHIRVNFSGESSLAQARPSISEAKSHILQKLEQRTLKMITPTCHSHGKFPPRAPRSRRKSEPRSVLRQ